MTKHIFCHVMIPISILSLYTHRSLHLSGIRIVPGENIFCVSLLSLLAAFEVFSIPAANGIIDLFYFNRTYAGALWIFMAALSGGVAFYLYGEEKK